MDGSEERRGGEVEGDKIDEGREEGGKKELVKMKLERVETVRTGRGGKQREEEN